ncbi:MAG: exodeoxyribonuclease VII small subunit, partial [Gemmatimonadota bacterium]
MTQIPIEDETATGDGKDGQPIEEQLKRLDAIVEKLESEAVSLDQSIALFEEGVDLAVQIRRRLEVSEGRI